MKKKLEAELISIAHRILKMKNRDDVVQLHQEAQNLYEKLSILRFYEENIVALKPTLSQEALEEKMEQAYVEKVVVAPEVKEEIKAAATPEEVVIVSEVAEEIPAEEEKIVVGQITIDEDDIDDEELVTEAEPVIEEEEEILEEPVAAEEPKEEEEKLLFEPVSVQVKEEKKAEPQQISFEDLLGNSYTEPEFVKVNEVPKEVEKVAEITFEKATEVLEEPVKKEVIIEEPSAESIKKEIESEKDDYKALSLNDKFNKTITLGLNDRIAFEKHLFGGSGEDLNRVLSQLNTFNTLEEAQSFIDDLVKPDYNDWQGKDEYSSRFMELVEKKFA